MICKRHWKNLDKDWIICLVVQMFNQISVKHWQFWHFFHGFFHNHRKLADLSEPRSWLAELDQDGTRTLHLSYRSPSDDPQSTGEFHQKHLASHGFNHHGSYNHSCASLLYVLNHKKLIITIVIFEKLPIESIIIINPKNAIAAIIWLVALE